MSMFVCLNQSARQSRMSYMFKKYQHIIFTRFFACWPPKWDGGTRGSVRVATPRPTALLKITRDACAEQDNESIGFSTDCTTTAQAALMPVRPITRGSRVDEEEEGRRQTCARERFISSRPPVCVCCCGETFRTLDSGNKAKDAGAEKFSARRGFPRGRR